MAVLDTDVLIDFLNDKNNAKNIVNAILKDEILFITSINEYELLKGAYNSNHPEKHVEEIKIFLSKFKLLLLDYRCIEIAAKAFSKLSKKGEIIHDLDILIGGICIANSEKLVTRNIRDFSKIEGLQIYKDK